MKTLKMTRRDFTKTGTLATLGIMTGCSIRNQFDIIIKNGLVIDGTGNPGQKIDLGIKDNYITALADLSTATADHFIDAKNMVVSPGFIDIHTHTDTELIVDPKGESKLRQGVTTEIGGNCGSSVFPMTDDEYAEYDKNFNERYGISVKWKDIDGFFKALEKRKIAINYASFTGHGDIRAFAMGRNDVPPTNEQLDQMKKLIAHSMEMGSLGLSTGLEYAPSSYAKTDELIELCKVVANYNGVYATHMRNEDDTVEEAIEEALKICQKSGASTQISHLKACNKNNWHKVDHMLELIRNAADSGLQVKADRYPYTAYGTGLSVFLPLWSRQGETSEILKRLEDKSLLPKIKEFALSRGARIGGWDRVVISSCFNEENKKWEGKSILEAAETTGKEPFEFIRNLIIEERSRVNIVGFAMSEENIKKVYSSPFVMIGSDGSAISPDGKLGTGKPHPRYYGTFPRVLGKYCREENVFDLPTAIKKMTSMPAEKLNLQKRGIIKQGNFADIVIFNPDTVIDNATFVNPHQFPTGINQVIVNGKIAISDGKFQNNFSGKVIRHG